MATKSARSKRQPTKATVADNARIHCIIPNELHKRVKLGCVLEGVSMTDVIAELLEARFPRKK